MDDKTLGTRISRKLFENRGNHSEMHLSEAELAQIIDVAIEWSDKTAASYINEKLGRVK